MYGQSITSLFIISFLSLATAVLLSSRTEARSCTSTELQELIKGFEIADAIVLDTAAQCDSSAIPVFANALTTSGNARVRSRSAYVLGVIGQGSEQALPALEKALNDQIDSVRRSAIDALGNFGSTAKPAIPALLQTLKHTPPNIRVRAATALGNIRVEAKTVVPALIRTLNTDQDTEVQASAASALSKFGIEAKEAIPFLVSALKHKNELIRRASALSLGSIAVALLDEADETKKLEKMNETLTVLSEMDKALSNPEFEDAKKRVVRSLDHLKQALLVESVTQWGTNGADLWLAHLAFWLALIFAYPKSRQVQALFFWNPWVRKLMGAGYVGFLLTLVSPLRRKLFEPFQTDLRADAGLENFDHQSYFGGSEVKTKGWKTAKPIKDVIPTLKGQIILQAESGLGKTTYLRYLMRQSKRIAVYLTAVECAQTKDKDVIQAVQAKLPVAAADADFLRSLIYSGAIDIYIDGLNEVNAETRAKIATFVRSYSKGNIIVTTQPLPDWTPPSTAQTYILQPLGKGQIVQFLVSRPLPNHATVRDTAYAKACHTYLEQALNDQQPPNDLEVARRVLSNPMDLDTVAAMLAKGEQPDLFHLQAQLYAVVANDYRERHLGYAFPLKQVSEAAYQMRLKDKLTLPKKEFDDAIVCMERQRMVVSKQSQDAEDKSVREWYFRHDKLWEFFIAQTFLSSKPDAEQRRKDHMGDPRFRGVYLLLGSAMPIAEAISLMDEFVLYGANNDDHTVSDPLVQIVSSR